MSQNVVQWSNEQGVFVEEYGTVPASWVKKVNSTTVAEWRQGPVKKYKLYKVKVLFQGMKKLFYRIQNK